MVRNFFIGGNWKMNGSVKQAKELVEMLNGFEVPANTGKFFFFLFNSSIEDDFIYSHILQRLLLLPLPFTLTVSTKV